MEQSTSFCNDILQLSIRQLQTESGLALTIFRETNTSLANINKQVFHDSHQFYRLIIQKYVNEYGGLPSKIGPASTLKLLY